LSRTCSMPLWASSGIERGEVLATRMVGPC
jgi:hypothetical protein